MLTRRTSGALAICLLFTQSRGDDGGLQQTANVLDQVSYRDGERQILLQRIAPPVATPPNRPLPSQPAPQPDAAPEKPQHFLFYSATVYTDSLSYVQWTVGQRKYGAFVNVDFKDVAGIGTFETASASYSLFLSIAQSSPDELAAENIQRLAVGATLGELIQLPAPAVFPPGASTYLLKGEANPEHVDADCAGLEELLAYYDANKALLYAARQQRESDQKARELWLKEHPPVPQDTILQFWPIKSNSYPTAEGGAAR